LVLKIVRLDSIQRVSSVASPFEEVIVEHGGMAVRVVLPAGLEEDVSEVQRLNAHRLQEVV
jgi:hypothetical protein